MLTALACHTSRIQIAAGIANVYSRTPALVAQCAATLDEVSGKRAILGLGTSGAKVIRDWHGVPYDRPMQRTREYIEIVRLALSGQRVNYDGEIYRLRDFRIAAKPPRPDTPIFVASLGPKNVRLTGELADGWAPLYVSPNYLPQLQAWLAEGADRAGATQATWTCAPTSSPAWTTTPRWRASSSRATSPSTSAGWAATTAT